MAIWFDLYASNATLSARFKRLAPLIGLVSDTLGAQFYEQ